MGGVRGRLTEWNDERGFGLLAPGAFFVLLATLVLTGLLPSVVFAAYVILGVATFAAYAMDKAASQRGAWRTPESTLHLLALAGGWPGALFAQQVLRHKTIKQPFRMVFWGTVASNCLLLTVFLIGSGGG